MNHGKITELLTQREHLAKRLETATNLYQSLHSFPGNYGVLCANQGSGRVELDVEITKELTQRTVMELTEDLAAVDGKIGAINQLLSI